LSVKMMPERRLSSMQFAMCFYPQHGIHAANSLYWNILLSLSRNGRGYYRPVKRALHNLV